MIYFVLSIILTLVSRFYMAYWMRHGAVITDGDSMGHLTYVKEYYRTGGKPIDLSHLYILDGPDYPNGFHKLFYHLRIPVVWLQKYGGYLPTIFDCVHLTMAFAAISILGGGHYEWLLFFPFLRIFWGNEGRAAHFSERAYGVLWGNMYLLSVAAFYLTADWFWLVLALPAFAVASISSKFTWQAVTFFSVILSIVSGTFVFVAAYIGAVCFAVVVTRGYAWHVLKGVVRHSLFYRSYLSPRNPTALRNNYKELWTFCGGIRKYVQTLFTNAPLRIFSDFPVSIVIILSILLGQSVDFWGGWVLAGLALVLAIATTPLKFLGEPERYLEFCVVPAFVFLSSFGFSEYPFATILAGLAAGIVVMFHVMLLRAMRRTGIKDKDQVDLLNLRDFFRNIRRARIVTIPFRLSFFLGYESNGNDNAFVTLFSNIGIGDMQDQYRWLMKDRYPFVRNDLDLVIQRYQLDYIVVRKASVQSLNREYEGGYYNFNPYKTVYENDSYVVYGVKG